MKNNIVLIGFMGAGKTEVGRILAKNAGLNFIDLDFLIETHEGMAISEIFKRKGEDYFRKLETEILKGIETKKNDIFRAIEKYIDTTKTRNAKNTKRNTPVNKAKTAVKLQDSENIIVSDRTRPWVISTGGGMPVFNGNMKLLKNIGTVLYLKAGARTIYERIKTESHRPVLGDGGFGERDIEDKLVEREKFYGKADIIIYTEGLTMHGVADEINIFLG
jgi:shikimate kinase